LIAALHVYFIAGEICHVKAGDRYLISRANFEKWLNGNHVKKVAPDEKEKAA
jgi:hypothetical protein